MYSNKQLRFIGHHYYADEKIENNLYTSMFRT